jgi:DNA-binding LacI/PurR family transcriptional regulator
MRDVAKLAGVSQSTVSRVLSNTPSSVPISEETAQKVFAAVAHLGYYPNLTARSLRAQHSFMIAIMIADISNAFYHFIVRTVQDIARQHHYDVLIANTDQIYENEKSFCEAIMRRPVDGVIMVPYHLTDEEIDQFINRTGTPVVALASYLKHKAVDVVFADDESGTYNAVKWLINDKHHERVGFIGVPENYPPGMRRHNGYKRAMQDARLPLIPEYQQQGDFTVESGQTTMHTLLSLPQPPTAVFICNDLMAIGAINMALDMNFRVPQDIAVVGFDNIPEATLIRPKLTTVAQFPVDMGRQLAVALLERIEGQETGPRRAFELPLQLIERDST